MNDLLDQVSKVHRNEDAFRTDFPALMSAVEKLLAGETEFTFIQAETRHGRCDEYLSSALIWLTCQNRSVVILVKRTGSEFMASMIKDDRR